MKKLEREMVKELGVDWLKKPVSRRMLAATCDVLTAKIKQLEKKIAMLEERIKHVDQKDLWGGIYQKDCEYPGNVIITCDGAMWYSMRATSAKPGTPGSGWQLMHKTHGRNR